MSTKPNVSEHEARAVAEGARETTWEAPSFVRELFLGKLDLGLIHPWPEPDPEEQKRAEPFLAKLEQFLREHVDNEVIERDAKIPDAVVQGLRDMGAFGIKIPVEYGGLGLSQYTYCRAMSLVSSVNASLVALLSAHQSIGVPGPVKMFGNDEQKHRLLPRLAKGAISAFALTEEEVGSDPARMTTVAVPTEDGSAYVLNGTKLWITNGTVAELMVVMARTPGKDGKPGPISAFVVETNSPGFEVVKRLQFMGLRGIENAVLKFTNVRVPKENLLWGEGKGLKLALVTLNTGRLTIPAGCAALGKWALGVCRQWANARQQWGKNVGRHDAIAQMLAKMAADTYAMEAIADLGSLLADRGKADIRLEAAIGKMWNTDVGWALVDDAIQIRGGRGYETAQSLASRGDVPVALEQAMRDMRINKIFEGSNQVMRLFIAREALDVHLKVAGDVVMPNVPMDRRLAGLVRSGLFYAGWYPTRWLGWGHWPQYSEFGALAGHMRWIERTSRRLARQVFHLMVVNGPALERRQSQLFRCVDAGAELFAMAVTCSRALRDTRKGIGEGSAIALADTFCRAARRRVDASFAAIQSNDDVSNYETAKGILGGKFTWLEKGVVPAPSIEQADRAKK
ncbi:MAG: acyl-CoA dehydrogenase family protein [Candidatus Eisenbacteria bacterium]